MIETALNTELSDHLGYESISPRKAQIAVMGLVLKPLQLKMDNWL